METKEALGGYLGFEADDLDAATSWVRGSQRPPMGGAIEVRPVAEW
ncbi:MAG: YciI family protein [Actinomycetota bacterium]|nr:YciI family protein [Actinomycetota bacterium]